MATSKVNVRSSSAKTYTFEVDLSITVQEMKVIIEKETGIAPDHQRLIYSGQVMTNERTLESYSIKSGHTMHLVARKPKEEKSTPQDTPAQTQQPPPPNMFNMFPGGGFGAQPGIGGFPINPQTITQLMQNPAIQQYMQQLMQNPQMMQQLLQNNPLAQQMLQNNPQMAHLFQNPDFFRQMSDPAVINSVLQIYQQMFPGMGGLGGMGAMGGMGGLGGMGGMGFPYGMPGPVIPPNMGNNPTTGTSTGSSTGTSTGTTGTSTSTPVENYGIPTGTSSIPTATATQGTPGIGVAQPNLAQLFQQMGGIFPQVPIVQPPGNPEERYSVQLQQLSEMGFTNRAVNIQALMATNGNVEAAIERLLMG